MCCLSMQTSQLVIEISSVLPWASACVPGENRSIPTELSGETSFNMDSIATYTHWLVNQKKPCCREIKIGPLKSQIIPWLSIKSKIDVENQMHFLQFPRHIVIIKGLKLLKQTSKLVRKIQQNPSLWLCWIICKDCLGFSRKLRKNFSAFDNVVYFQ